MADPGHFFTPYINMSPRFCTFADKSDLMEMESKTVTLIIIWFVAVVAFFVLWAILLKVVKRISEKKRPEETALDDFEKEGKDDVTPTGV